MRRTALIALGLALLAAGCAAPGTPGRPSGTAKAVAEAEQRHELPAAAAPASEPAPSPTADGNRDPLTAVRAFATAYINWTARTVTAQLRTLASLSVGQARAAMTLAAGETARDYELRRGGVANHGTVEAVAALSGRRHEYVVVTRELTTATATDAYRGLAPAWHVALATVTPVAGGGWALSAWQPEN